MNFYTVDEFNTMKLYELDNVTYNKIENKFSKLLGEKIAKNFLKQQLGTELKTFSANSYVNIMDCIKII